MGRVNKQYVLAIKLYRPKGLLFEDIARDEYSARRFAQSNVWTSRPRVVNYLLKSVSSESSRVSLYLYFRDHYVF